MEVLIVIVVLLLATVVLVSGGPCQPSVAGADDAGNRRGHHPADALARY